MSDTDVFELLREGRRRERAQTLFYRGLTARAEEAGDASAAERLNALLADEQHHLSRLTARLLELGGHAEAIDVPAQPDVPMEAWEGEARRREQEEVAWYEEAVALVGDEPTRAVLTEILLSERHHRDELGGKWMPASRDPRAPGGET